MWQTGDHDKVTQPWRDSLVRRDSSVVQHLQSVQRLQKTLPKIKVKILKDKHRKLCRCSVVLYKRFILAQWLSCHLSY